MIPKIAVDEYLDRDFDNHVWIKDLSKDLLWDEVSSLTPRPKLFDGLRAHQLACFLLGVAFPQFAFWLDMGTGKTLVSLELLRYWWLCGKIRRAVVKITSDKAFPTWEKQIKRFGVDLPYTLLEGSSEDKWQRMREFGDGVFFVSYPGAAAMVTEPVKVKKGKRAGRTRWKLNADLVEEFWWDVDALVMDESTRASSHDSIAFASIEKSQADIRYALAGRPFGRDPTLLWAQQYLVDRGETFGETLGLFRAAFFTDTPNRWVPKKRQKYIRKWTFDKRKESELARLIPHRSITYAAEECIDLPEHEPIVEEVKFSAEAADYFEQAVETLIKSKGSVEVTKNIFLRMRQLSSGFMGYADDETGERAHIEFDENPKFDRLLERLDEMPMDRQGVVFYDFTFSGRKIFEATERLGFKPIWIWSGNKNYAADLAAFEAGKRHLAIINNRIGAMSLDGLQVANYAHLYESPVSVIDREQVERRLRREGQTRTVFQYDYVVRGSVDQKILDFHKEGEALITALLKNPSMLLNRR